MISLPPENSRVVCDDKVSNGEGQLTSQEVTSALRENRERFDRLACDIRTIAVVFNDDRRIMPMQCREAITSLEEAQRYVQLFHNLLDTPDRLPVIFSALRYRLVFQIHLIERQAEQLIGFIERYHAICTSTTG